MMDHLSSKSCAAAESTYIAIQAGIVAIASKKNRIIDLTHKTELSDNAG
jgi:hypothetical protein